MEEFDAEVRKWLATARYTRYDRLYTGVDASGHAGTNHLD